MKMGCASGFSLSMFFRPIFERYNNYILLSIFCVASRVGGWRIRFPAYIKIFHMQTYISH